MEIETGFGVKSVSHTPNQARLRTLSNVELRATPLVEHYSLYHSLAIYSEVTFFNVTSVAEILSNVERL